MKVRGKIAEYAKEGENFDVMTALRLLTKEYMRWCGFSLGYRTLIFDCGTYWVDKLAGMDLPLSEKARQKDITFVALMPDIEPSYDPEYYDQYDITGFSEKEYRMICHQYINDKDNNEDVKKVLCWGFARLAEDCWDSRGNWVIFNE